MSGACALRVKQNMIETCTGACKRIFLPEAGKACQRPQKATGVHTLASPDKQSGFNLPPTKLDEWNPKTIRSFQKSSPLRGA